MGTDRRSIRIERRTLPDPPAEIAIVANDGTPIGVLEFTFDKSSTTSRLIYATGQQPHRTYPFRKKHRQQ